MVAFLVLAHAEPKMLARLAGRLRSPQTHIFIHLDKRANAKNFRDILPTDGNVTYVPDRVRVAIHWGGFSMMRAELALLREALAHPAGFGRFFLLSGADYPVKPLAEITSALRSDEELVRVDRVLSASCETQFDQRGHRLAFVDRTLTNPRTSPRLLSRLLRAVENRSRRHYRHGDIYYGPQWWSITRAAAEYLVSPEAWEKMKFFRLSVNPDEMIVQTLLKNSRFAPRISQDVTLHEGLPERHAAHYVDFGAGGPSPKVLDIGDLTKIRHSGALFARKMDPKVSAELLDALDQGS